MQFLLSKKLRNVLKQIENTFFDFAIFVFEKCLFKLRIVWIFFSSQKIWNVLKRILAKYGNFAIFIFLDVVDFVLNIRSEFGI